MILFLQLLLAHLAGDFFLQPATWVKQKEERQRRSPILYWHILIHFLLIVLFRFDISFWLTALMIAFSHLIIDLVKIEFQQPHNRRIWFFADQALHILVLVLVAWYYSSASVTGWILQNPQVLVILTAAIFLLQPTAVIIRMVISHWTPTGESPDQKSLQNAGKLIGMLERILVLIFILMNKWEGVGFLLGAKSIFRFGDLKGNSDRKLTEYILIGTLISFSIAIVTGIFAQYYFANLHQK